MPRYAFCVISPVEEPPNGSMKGEEEKEISIQGSPYLHRMVGGAVVHLAFHWLTWLMPYTALACDALEY